MKIYYVNILFLPFIYLLCNTIYVKNNDLKRQENKNSYDDDLKYKKYRGLSSNLIENSSYQKQFRTSTRAIQNSISPRALSPQDLLDVFNQMGNTDFSYDYDRNGVVDSDDVTRAYLLWKEDTHMLQESISCESETQVKVDITPFSMRTGQNANITTSMELRVTLHFPDTIELDTIITGTNDNSNRIIT